MFEKCYLLLSIGAVPLLAIFLLPLALLLGAAVYSLLCMKVELRLLGKRAVNRAELESALHPMTAELEELRARLNEAERAQHSPAGLPGEPEFLHLNRRAQILGLHRKGTRVPEIAAVLHIPQGEVELMVKVYDLSQSASREVRSISLL